MKTLKTLIIAGILLNALGTPMGLYAMTPSDADAQEEEHKESAAAYDVNQRSPEEQEIEQFLIQCGYDETSHEAREQLTTLLANGVVAHLREAVIHQDEAMVQELLIRQADPHTIDAQSGKSLLRIAIELGNIRIANMLTVLRQPDEIKSSLCVGIMDHMTKGLVCLALYNQVKQDSPDKIKINQLLQSFLLMHDGYESTPEMEEILARIPDINDNNTIEITSSILSVLKPLTARSSIFGGADIVNMCLEISDSVDADSDSLKNALVAEAITQGNIELLQMLMRKGATIQKQNSRLHFLAARGCFEMLECLFTQYGLDPHYVTEEGHSLLWAPMLNINAIGIEPEPYEKTIQLLVSHGVVLSDKEIREQEEDIKTGLLRDTGLNIYKNAINEVARIRQISDRNSFRNPRRVFTGNENYETSIPVILQDQQKIEQSYAAVAEVEPFLSDSFLCDIIHDHLLTESFLARKENVTKKQDVANDDEDSKEEAETESDYVRPPLPQSDPEQLIAGNEDVLQSVEYYISRIQALINEQGRNDLQSAAQVLYAHLNASAQTDIEGTLWLRPSEAQTIARALGNQGDFNAQALQILLERAGNQDTDVSSGMNASIAIGTSSSSSSARQDEDGAAIDRESDQKEHEEESASAQPDAQALMRAARLAKFDNQKQ